jgi:predicted RNA binding protein YcfA (HicA-like mRNA interferase family)
MKRRDFETHLRRHGCEILREGGGHTIWMNTRTGRTSAVPRHSDIKVGTARRICEVLDVPTAPFR